MELLPTELYFEIFSHLENKDWINAVSVCRKWNKIQAVQIVNKRKEDELVQIPQTALKVHKTRQDDITNKLVLVCAHSADGKSTLAAEILKMLELDASDVAIYDVPKYSNYGKEFRNIYEEGSLPNLRIDARCVIVDEFALSSLNHKSFVSLLTEVKGTKTIIIVTQYPLLYTPADRDLFDVIFVRDFHGMRKSYQKMYDSWAKDTTVSSVEDLQDKLKQCESSRHFLGINRPKRRLCWKATIPDKKTKFT
jgi:hypothetical protein